MADSIESVRMPSSLLKKLRILAKDNHFLDVSEEMRSVIKTQIRRYKLTLGETKPIKDEITPKDYKTQNKVKQEMIKKLKQMINQLESQNE